MLRPELQRILGLRLRMRSQLRKAARAARITILLRTPRIPVHDGRVSARGFAAAVVHRVEQRGS